VRLGEGAAVVSAIIGRNEAGEPAYKVFARQANCPGCRRVLDLLGRDLGAVAPAASSLTRSSLRPASAGLPELVCDTYRDAMMFPEMSRCSLDGMEVACFTRVNEVCKKAGKPIVIPLSAERACIVHAEATWEPNLDVKPHGCLCGKKPMDSIWWDTCH